MKAGEKECSDCTSMALVESDNKDTNKIMIGTNNKLILVEINNADFTKSSTKTIFEL